MARTNDIVIRFDRCLCEVNGEPGYFHCWSHVSKPEMSSKIYGIVEFIDGVKYIEPTDIKFRDDVHEYLTGLKKVKEATPNG